MNVNRNTKRAAALGLSALVLSSVMLFSVACTRDDHKNPGDTTAGNTQTTTTPATGNGNGSGSDKPLDPDAGTVKPDNDSGNPPAGTEDGNDSGSTESGTKGSRGILPHFMH